MWTTKNAVGQCGKKNSARRDMQALSEPSLELAIVLRHMGGVQVQVSALVRQQQLQIEQLQTQLMRMRAQRLLDQTQRFWGLVDGSRPANPLPLPTMAVSFRKAKPSLTEKAWQAAQKIICQTGCVGHAHHWLQDDGQCARTGQDCDAQTTEETRRCA
jgi:hypothetical protein